MNNRLKTYFHPLVKRLYINNQRELSLLIDKYLIPQENEKKQNAEVSTPFKLRQEMLDTLPPSFWSRPRKVLEPCSGKGGFVVDIIDRFMSGLMPLIPDEKERYRVIVEECLYFIDINPTNIFLCRLLVDPYNEYKLNWHEGDTLKLDIREKWGIEGFDAVIGNPPYSTDPSKQDTKPLYHLFIDRFIDRCRYLLFVIPSRWFVGGKGLDRFRARMMSRGDIRLIRHEEDAKQWFGSIVEIKGGVCYVLKDKEHKGACLFNGEPYELDKYDCIIDPRHHGLIDPVAEKVSLASIYMGMCFGVETNDERLKDEGPIKCYVSKLKRKDRCRYLDHYDFNEKNRFWKVIVSRAAHGAYSGFGEMFIAGPEEIHTGSYISFRVSTRKEALSLLSYLRTESINYLLSIRKISQDINKNTLKWIPMVPLDRIWDERQVREFLKL